MVARKKTPDRTKKHQAKTDKRARTDSVAVQSKLLRDALDEEPLDPPKHVHLRKGDRPFWDSLVRVRARETWNTSDLEQAANLARTKADIERLQKEIDKEGDTTTNSRGTVVANPKHAVLEVLTRRSITLSRMLHLHAEATTGDSRSAKDAAEAELAAREDAARLKPDVDDGLIPRAHSLRH